ncbi:alpha-methylacyl-CoA racemase [Ostrinia furnacalis]|uniref:alpha-methylacyl-CoA racemase n=1 Tax=Ostrinia furnacalis TaxID=93504 RepID=UPI00103CFD58|nr:alpha-methylacyl-CoA racemase [Ostrinia furnacalis]
MALRGLKVIEFLGLAPGPLCGTFLADFGATVTVINKIGPAPFDVLSNGKKVISVDLKCKQGLDIVNKLCASSDVLIDTFRPGVLEKLGLGPESLLKKNPRLIYARLTGYGQTGPYKDKAGHDINYVAMSGILSLLGRNGQPPMPPINLLADFAGGSLTCTLGIILALFERTKSGKGQVIDCGMTEGLAYLSTWLFKARDRLLQGEPGTNLLDGGFPFYSTYKTKDGKFMAVGALEPQFYANLLEGLQLSADKYPQADVEECRKKFEEIFKSKTQEEWCKIFENLDACVTPVLAIDSIDDHEYHKNKNTFFRDSENKILPEPSPTLSRTPGVSVGKEPLPPQGQHTVQILKELGYSDKIIQDFLNKGYVYAHEKSKL